MAKMNFPPIPESLIFNAYDSKIPVNMTIPEQAGPPEKVAGCLGSMEGDPMSCQIFINPDRPEVIQWIALIHEYMHFVEDMMIDGGVIQRRMGEKFVTVCAASLFGMLAMNGLLKDFPSKTVIKNQLKKHEPMFFNPEGEKELKKKRA